MFVGRRGLQRISFPNVPRFTTTRFQTRVFSHAAPIPYAANVSIHPCRTYAGHEKVSTVEPNISGKGDSASLLRGIQTHHYAKQKHKNEERQSSATAATITLDSYQSARRRGKAAVQKITIGTLSRIARLAAEHRAIEVVNNLALDLVELFSERQMSDLRAIAKQLLCTREPLLRPERAMDLLYLFEPNPAETTGPPMDKKLLQRLIHAVLAHPDTTSDQLMKVTSYVIVRIRQNTIPTGVRYITHHPPPIIRESFHLTRRFLEKNANESAMQVFQELVNTRNVPPEAINMFQGQQLEFRVTVLNVLAKSAIHWGWPNEAIAAILFLLESCPSEQAKTCVLAVDTLRNALDEGSLSDLRLCRRLMRELDSRATTIPDELILRFYNMAYRLDAGDEAEQFYAYTRSDAVINRKEYPPPFGRPLLFLLRQLTEKSRNRHLGRQLVNQVVTRKDLIPVQDRANFIAVTASHGYAIQARALWTKYSMERYREKIVGSAATMLRMTELFTHVLTTTHTKLDRLMNVQRDPTGIDLPARPMGYFTLKRTMTEGRRTLDDIEANKGARASFRPELKIYTRLIDDLKMFIQCVIEEFRKVHAPIPKARHYDLNALARAYFMVGNIPAGFEVMKTLMDRREIPNLRDINVALGAIAAYDVQKAARMVDVMIRRGIKPNEVTIGTVLHHAMQTNNVDLASKLMKQAKQYPGALSLESLSSVIRFSVTRDGRPGAAVRSNLAETLRIMRTLQDRRYVCTPEMGKYCIFASLSVQDAVMAFKFWQMLVKDRTEWKDDEQAYQRRLIAGQVRKRRREGTVSLKFSAWMLSELGEAVEE